MKNNQFKPPWWLKNRHLQSCYASFVRRNVLTPLRWEEINLPDSDFIDIAWAGDSSAPIVLLLHGLEGSIHSHYIQLLLDELVDAGWQVAVMHYRACSGRINRLPESYNAAETKDLKFLIDVFKQRYPQQKFNVVGFSLGGNILLHYLTKEKESVIDHAIVVSTPYRMAASADQMPSLYQHYLLRALKSKVIAKIKAGIELPVMEFELKRVKCLREFDKLVTAPLYKFSSAEDYYDFASCRDLLKNIEHEVLIIHALDDPFVPKDTIPSSKELSPSIQFELNQWGGHVGFIAGGLPWRPRSWLNQRILQYLKQNKYF